MENVIFIHFWFCRAEISNLCDLLDKLSNFLIRKDMTNQSLKNSLPSYWSGFINSVFRIFVFLLLSCSVLCYWNKNAAVHKLITLIRYQFLKNSFNVLLLSNSKGLQFLCFYAINYFIMCSFARYSLQECFLFPSKWTVASRRMVLVHEKLCAVATTDWNLFFFYKIINKN